MKQFPFAINTIKELQDRVEQVREESRQMPALSSVLVSVFMDTSKVQMLHDIQQGVQAVFPEAQIIGAVSSGELVMAS